MSPASMALPLTTENNQSLTHHTDSEYLMAQIVSYISYIITAAALVYFVLGNLGAKLAAI